MKPRVLIYVEHPMCSMACADAVWDILKQTNKYEVILTGPSSFPRLDLNLENLLKSDCIIIPGGMGDADQFDRRLKYKKNIMRHYIDMGGKYLGICQGSYFAGSHFFDLLQGYESVQYIKRKTSDIKKTGPSLVNIKWGNEDKTRSIYFHDGAAFVPTKKEVTGEVKARYTNGDIASLVQDCGKGRIGLIGPHPEAPKWWFYSQARVKEGWKTSLQHDILLDLMRTILN